MTTIYQSECYGTNPAQQTKAHESRTDKYQFIDSAALHEVFFDHGFRLESMSYANSRKRDGFQKHIGVFTRDDLIIGDSHMQLLQTNAHDGSAAYGLDIGIFRAICANGMVSGDIDTSVKVRHTKNALGKIDKAIEYLLERMPQVAANVEAMRQVTLEPEQIRQLTRQAVVARTGKTPTNVVNIRATRALDAGNQLWKVFNRIQEKALRGGLEYIDANDKWQRTRRITEIKRTIKLNKQLWSDAMELVA